ncbi:MAG TPA: four helix bundle protein [Saprospiraceae bacterium]|nr:four helix bundle protein [Saprospiraceae bacterium]HMQ82328.1 four helix bundle protein [Saprospiraceae bacterium]
MFDFEKLEVYQKLFNLNTDVLSHLASSVQIDVYLKDQLKRATLSAALNLAEGTGRVSSADKKRFYVIARSSIFESVAILQVMESTGNVSREIYDDWYGQYETVSKMLLSMYRNVKDTRDE